MLISFVLSVSTLLRFFQSFTFIVTIMMKHVVLLHVHIVCFITD